MDADSRFAEWHTSMNGSPINENFQSFEEYCKREDPVYPRNETGLFRCPCCLQFTLDEVAAYEICYICYWEDDGTNGDHAFSPNALPLAEAQENYKKFGACEEWLTRNE